MSGQGSNLSGQSFALAAIANIQTRTPDPNPISNVISTNNNCSNNLIKAAKASCSINANNFVKTTNANTSIDTTNTNPIEVKSYINAAT